MQVLWISTESPFRYWLFSTDILSIFLFILSLFNFIFSFQAYFSFLRSCSATSWSCTFSLPSRHIPHDRLLVDSNLVYIRALHPAAKQLCWQVTLRDHSCVLQLKPWSLVAFLPSGMSLKLNNCICFLKGGKICFSCTFPIPLTKFQKESNSRTSRFASVWKQRLNSPTAYVAAYSWVEMSIYLLKARKKRAEQGLL